MKVPLGISRKWRCVILVSAVLVCGVLTASVQPQGTGAHDDSSNASGLNTAYLSLHYYANGSAQVSFVSDRDIQDWSPLRSALERALHCPAGTLQHPASSPLPFTQISSTRAAEWQKRYEEGIRQYRRRSLAGTCSGAMSLQGLQIYTGVALDPILQKLQKAGEQHFSVNVLYTPTKDLQWGVPGSRRNGQIQNLHYDFDVSKEQGFLHLQFGLTRAEALRTAALPIAVLLIPIVVVLWTRRVAVRRAPEDPVAAWFGFFRTLSLCTSGIIILWIVGQSVRQGFELLAAPWLVANDTRTALIKAAIFLLPPWCVAILCALFSYRVYVHVRGNTWTYGEFCKNQFATLATQIVPLAVLFCAIEMIRVNFRVAFGLGVSFFFLRKILLVVQMRITSTQPEPLTTGELRDCVYALAKKAAVEIRQILIMPTERSMVANAFATRNGVVLFTDYLLKRLNKREVSAIAAHEIAHLQKRHGAWRGAAFVALILAPGIFRILLDVAARLIEGAALTLQSPHSYQVFRYVGEVQAFPELDLVFFVIALGLFYLFARHQENSADAGAVRLSGDPEAAITALLKLTLLNLHPIRWGKVSGAAMTHPSTLRRIQHIARIGQISPERLQQILDESQSAHRQAGTAAEEGCEKDGFSNSGIVAKTPKVVSAARTTQLALLKLWILRFLHIGPPMLIAWAVFHWHLRPAFPVYTLGALLTLALYFVISHWMAVWGRAKVQEEFRAKLSAEGLPVDDKSARMVGFAPSGEVRFYRSKYNWDSGYLFFTRERMCFFGDMTRFALTLRQVRNVRLGAGGPGWLRVPRVYVDWWDESTSSMRTWNMASLAPCSFWGLRKQSRDLLATVESWRLRELDCAELPAAFEALPEPCTGEVTSLSLQQLHSFKRMMRSTFTILFLAATIGFVMQLHHMLYVYSCILMLRLYESLPWWFRAREKHSALNPRAEAVRTGAQ